jgi:hypothetical protein
MLTKWVFLPNASKKGNKNIVIIPISFLGYFKSLYVEILKQKTLLKTIFQKVSYLKDSPETQVTSRGSALFHRFGGMCKNTQLGIKFYISQMRH